MNGLGRNDNQNSKRSQSSVFTKQTLGVVLVLFATICLICLITRDSIFYTPGLWINSFLLGCFGYCAYAVNIWVIIIGVLLVTSKKLPISGRFKFLGTVFFCLVTLLLHIISFNEAGLSYGEYLSSAYTKASSGLVGSTAGGLFTSLVAYWFIKVLSAIGSYVVISLSIVGIIYLFVKDYLKLKNGVSNKTFRSSFVKKENQEALDISDVEISGEMEYPVQGVVNNEPLSEKPTQKLFISNAEDFALKSKREIAKGKDQTIRLDYSNSKIPLGITNSGFPATSQDEFKKKIEYIKTPAVIDINSTKYNQPGTSSTTVSDYIPVSEEKQAETIESQTEVFPTVQEIPMFEHDLSGVTSDIRDRAEDFASRYAGVEEIDSTKNVIEPEEVFRPLDGVNVSAETITEPMENTIEPQKLDNVEDAPKASETVEETPAPSPIISDRRSRSILFGTEEKEKTFTGIERPSYTSRVTADRNVTPLRDRLSGEFENKPEIKTETQENKPEKKVAPINRIYNRPPIDLLEKYSVPVDAPRENHQERMEIIKQLLADFHINVEPQGYVQGPTITRYEIMMPPGISVKKVLSYDDDLKMRLASKFGVRIEAPIPGKNLVGVEVANNHKITVGLREVLEGVTDSDKPGALNFAIGKDIVGKSITDNLAKGPHYLIAGATGSGKSVALNVMIVSLIMRYSPEELRLILIDPKRVGFRNYEHIPHLLIDEIITEPQKAVSVLSWAYEEMEKRYGMFENCDRLISDIDEYNKEIASDTVAKLPRIVIIVDELADLMETCKKDMDMRIRMLAAKARAAGIHLVLATQRPSVDVITGTIKANLPSRMALKVMNYADSSTILSEGGAEKLLGNGDMLYKNSGMSECERYQGAWISNREITNVVNFIKEHNEAYFDDELSEFLANSTKPKQEETIDTDGVEDAEGEINQFFLKALWLAVNSGSVSISQLQRRFQIGYGRAGGLVDKMERMGFISGNEGSKARRVFLTREEFEERFGPMSDAY